MNEIFDHFKGVYSRIGLGLFAIITSLYSVFTDYSYEFDFEKFIGLLVAVAAWLTSEILSYDKPPSSHDIFLRNMIVNKLHDKMKFLLEHDLGGSFRDVDISPFHDVGENWSGVKYQFVDKELQKEWRVCLNKIREFSQFIAFNAHFVNNTRLINFKTEYDRLHGIQKTTWDKINEANSMATEIYERLQKIEELSIKKFGAPSAVQI